MGTQRVRRTQNHIMHRGIPATGPSLGYRCGTVVHMCNRMAEQTTQTVEMSLVALSDAVGKASEDLRAVRAALDVARADIASRNTSLSRDVISHAEQVIVHLRGADEGLRNVLKDLMRRD